MENYKNKEWLEKVFKENGNLQQIDSNNRKNNKVVLDHLYENATLYLDRKHKRYLDMYCSPIQ